MKRGLYKVDMSRYIPTIINFFPFEIDHVSMTVRMAVAVKRTFITMAAAAIGS